ncbi:hypothetical protein ES703_107072 [subsurface metagenome]
MPSADIVEPAVVCLAHNRIHRIDSLISGKREGVAYKGIGSRGYAQRIGQDYGRFNCSQFFNLGVSSQFSIAVGDVNSGRDFILIDISGMGEDSCYTCADIFALDQCYLPDFYSRNIGYGIPFAGLYYSGFNTEFSHAGSIFGREKGQT